VHQVGSIYKRHEVLHYAFLEPLVTSS